MYFVVDAKGKNEGGVGPSEKTMKLKYEFELSCGRNKLGGNSAEVHLAGVRYIAVLGVLS